MPIETIKHKGLRNLFETGRVRGLDARLAGKLEDMLAAIDFADEPEHAGVYPGWKLHSLTGDLDGYWSMTVTGNLRIIFRFEDGNAFDVDLVDYH